MRDHASSAVSTLETVLEVQPDDPTATSRSRNWPGLTVDLHAPLYDTDIFAPPNDHHLVIYSRSGGKLLQKRAGRSQHTYIPNGTTVIMPAGCESFWGADWPASARIRIRPPSLRIRSGPGS